MEKESSRGCPVVKLVNELRFGHAFFRLAEDPRRTEEVFRLSDVGLKMKASRGVELAVARAMADPGFRQLFESRYVAPAVDWDALSRLSEDTLGHQYFKHMKANGLDPDFFPDNRMKNEIEYLIQRGREAHDIWHVLAGYDTSVADELALQAFTLSQLDSPISGVLLASGILHFTRFEPEKIHGLLKSIDEGHERGHSAGYLLGVPWERHWGMELEEARQWMRIRARRDTPVACATTPSTSSEIQAS